MSKYGSYVTTAGQAALVEARANGQNLVLSRIAVGDGGGRQYTLREDLTALKRQVWRGSVSRIAVDDGAPNVLVIEGVVPQDVGGFTVREVGVFDQRGRLFAIIAYPDTVKPTLDSGVSKELLIRIKLAFSNAAQVNLAVSPQALVTHGHVLDQVTRHDRDPNAHGGMDIQDASETAKGKVELASVLEARAGTDRFRAVTPHGLRYAVGGMAPDKRPATTIRAGIVELATTLEATTGTDGQRAITPSGLKAALAAVPQAYDLPFVAGWNRVMEAEDLEVRHYGRMLAARSFIITQVKADLILAPKGASIRFDIRSNGSSIFRTPPSIGSNISTITTRAISASGRVSEGDRIDFLITQVGTTVKGQGMRLALQGKAS